MDAPFLHVEASVEATDLGDRVRLDFWAGDDEGLEPGGFLLLTAEQAVGLTDGDGYDILREALARSGILEQVYGPRAAL